MVESQRSHLIQSVTVHIGAKRVDDRNNGCKIELVVDTRQTSRESLKERTLTERRKGWKDTEWD